MAMMPTPWPTGCRPTAWHWWTSPPRWSGWPPAGRTPIPQQATGRKTCRTHARPPSARWQRRRWADRWLRNRRRSQGRWVASARRGEGAPAPIRIRQPAGARPLQAAPTRMPRSVNTP